MTREELHRIRHENYCVLSLLHYFPGRDRAEYARRLGIGEFAFVLILRRLALD